MTSAGPKLKIALVAAAFILLSLTLLGIFSILTSPQLIPGLSLSFFAGISMIFLPCTFPLVFIIVPIAMSRRPGKGLGMALLFGLGLTLTFTLYGIATGWVGGYIGLSKIVRAMLIVGGIAAFLFGLSELGLVRFRLPFRATILPARFQKSNDYLRSFLLGFFLGNAGVGCPNPAFYILFGYVATLGRADTGAYLGALHGIGRMVPLLLIVVLAILGVNATNVLSAWQFKAKRIVAWALVALGSFIFNYGLFGHTWFEESAIHKGWNLFLEAVVPRIAESEAIEQALQLPEGIGGVGPWLLFAGIIAVVVLWDAIRARKDSRTARTV